MGWLNLRLMVSAFFLTLLLIAIPSANACLCRCSDFELEILNPSVKSAPGSVTDIFINVRNTGNLKDDAIVKIKGVNPDKGIFWDESNAIHYWKSTFPNGYRKTKVNLDGGEEVTLKLKVEIPSNEKPGLYSYEIRLKDGYDKELLCYFICKREVESDTGNIELIPEFSTIAVPAGIALLAGLYFFRRQ